MKAPDHAPEIINTPPTEVKPLVLVPFPDGSLLRYAPNPCKAGTFVLVDAANTQVAVVVNEFVADFLARGAMAMLVTLRQAEASQNKVQAPKKRIIVPGS